MKSKVGIDRELIKKIADNISQLTYLIDDDAYICNASFTEGEVKILKKAANG